jgi:hypothetical protein
VRDFILVAPFFACEAPACSHAGERSRHLHTIRSTDPGTSPSLQIFLASAGEALGHLNAFLDRYYDIMRDAEANVVLLEGHDVDAASRNLSREDLPEFNPELLEREVQLLAAITPA